MYRKQLGRTKPLLLRDAFSVERGVRTLLENLLTNIKAGESYGKALDISLDLMRKTPHTRLKKSAFELLYGRKPNTEISNLLNLDEIGKLSKHSVSAKPDTLQVYSFSVRPAAHEAKEKRKGSK